VKTTTARALHRASLPGPGPLPRGELLRVQLPLLHAVAHGRNPKNDSIFFQSQWEEAITYIDGHPEIRDVLLSGGDPLTLSDEKLDWLLSRLHRIPHVEFLRIGTKAPVVMPQRITTSLLRVLKRYHPLWMSIHFTHPEELTPEAVEACGRLADAGIPWEARRFCWRASTTRWRS